jgi:hypothetical protein
MPKVDLREAMAENEEREGDLCRTCSAAAEEPWEPYCASCATYWKEVDEGLFDKAGQ